MSPQNASQTTDVDVVIIGAGFSGCYLLHKLRRQGFNVLVLEAGATIGGVWCWNRYPGARVDCEFPYYGFSDPAIWGTFKWSERFPSDSELRTYFQHVADVWDLHKDIKLNTHVTGAVYHDDPAGPYWSVGTSPGANYRCKWLVAATGTSFKPHTPAWPGLDQFKGAVHHSSLWPQGHGPDDTPPKLEGKKIAIIGAGSSGLQVMQEAAKVCSSATQFFRTPNFAIPMRQRSITEDELYTYKGHIPFVFEACKKSSSGLPVLGNGRLLSDDTPEAREAAFEEAWKLGGWAWSLGLYMDDVVDPAANREVYKFWRKKALARVRDPVKRDLLAPEEPPYYIGTKRPSLEQDYFECCDRENVDITNSPIAEFTATGIVTKDGRHREFDIVAICTGYDAVTGGLRTLGVKGRGGLDLGDHWKDGVLTNLGMFVNGFPNFSIMYGPQAPTSFTNGPIFLEQQGDFLVQVLLQQRQQRIKTVEAKQEAEQKWRTHVLQLVEPTLLVKTDSWWMGANIPGKHRECLLYAGGLPLYGRQCKAALEDWSGFEVQQQVDNTTRNTAKL